MGVEMVGADFTQGQTRDGIQENVDIVKPNQGSEPEETIKFGIVDGANGTTNGPTKSEADPASNANFPKDALDEWPAPKQIHSFYFVRFRSYEDPKLKAKLDQADKEIQKKNQARFQLTEAIKAKRSDRAAVISQLKPLTAEDRRYKMILDEKRKELEPLQAALGKLRSASNTAREKGVGLCSSEEELNDLIASLHYRMQHESNTLVEEKQLLREIKQLEGTRDKVIASAAMKAKIQDSLGQRDAIQDQVKLIGGNLDGVRKEQQAVRTKIKHLEEELNAIDNEIASMQEELTALSQKRDKAYETLNELRKQREEGNTYYYQNRSLLNNAKDLAAKKDIAALEELSHAEMKKYMSLWNSDKAFRDDYEKRILPSLDSRQLSRDGRMRNPDEKPIVSELPTPTETEAPPVKANIKRTKEPVNAPLEHEPVSISTVPKEGINKPTDVVVKAKGNVSEDTEDFYMPEKPKESPATNGIDAAKLKEMKREEEIAKAKQALERKKKLAEKAAAKAAIRAQKEAEKKLKEREKRAKKKAGVSAPAADADVVEEEKDAENDPEKTEANVEAPVLPKGKEPKETVRFRNRSKAKEPLPKGITLKRKKSPSYWVWAASASVALVLILAALAYYYFL
ncbi:proton pump-interactor 1-like [Magnolia sinica]|uniref:proton pump-interactor 1-like n=1 Tax=Magnolia sinica TaxID=86752 RepID=UPI002659694B|nr:proton pump-interactor 1-like [Magnolia sinica]XP_058095419.1 proton pump-interactor 1-like [Magnolia sinica]